MGWSCSLALFLAATTQVLADGPTTHASSSSSAAPWVLTAGAATPQGDTSDVLLNQPAKLAAGDPLAGLVQTAPETELASLAPSAPHSDAGPKSSALTGQAAQVKSVSPHALPVQGWWIPAIAVTFVGLLSVLFYRGRMRLP